MTHGPRRWPVALAGGLTVLALTACTGQLPTTSTPRAGLPVAVQAQQDVQRFPTPPQPDASATEVVQGFLRTSVGFADDNDVAREYLTRTLAGDWVPTQDVLVYDGTPEVQATGPGEVEVTAQVLGRVDEQGRLTEPPRGGTVVETFSLTRVSGQWRIDGFPDGFGLWLSRTDLDRAFRPTTLFYLNPHLDVFVPERRWLARTDGLTTSVVRAQLAPVPDYLQGAVTSAAGDDIRLAVPAVPVDGATQVATVNLQAPGPAEDSEVAVDLQAQLGRALLDLSGVQGVDIVVAGRGLRLDGDPEPITVGTALRYQDVDRDVDRALLRVGERFSVVDPTFYNLPDLPSTQTADVELPRLGMSWSGVAVTEDLSDLAAVSSAGTALWRWQDDEVFVNEGIGDRLTPPSVDPHGAFWLAGVQRSNAQPRAWVVDRDDLRALARPLQTPWLRERDRVLGLQISPDGTRALLVVGDTGGDRRRVLLAGIVRDTQGRPTGLTEPTAVAPSLVSVTSARWASTEEVFLVAARAEDPGPRAFRLRLGEWLQPLGQQAGLVDIVAVPTGTGVDPVVRTDDGRFHTEQGLGWFGARNGDELVIPGT